MEKMMTQLELPMNHVMGAPTEMVNTVAFKSYDEEEAKRMDEEI